MSMPFPNKVSVDFITYDEYIVFNTNVAEAFQLVLSPHAPYWIVRITQEE